MIMESLRPLAGRSKPVPREGSGQRPKQRSEERSGDRREEAAQIAGILPALRRSRHLLVAVKDRDGRYVEANEPYARALGLSVTAIRGRHDRDLLPPRIAGEVAQRERLAMRGVALKAELEALGDGEPTFLVERLPVLDLEGEVRGICLVAMEQMAGPLPEAAPRDDGCTTVSTRQGTPGASAMPDEPWLSMRAASPKLEWDAVLYRSLLSLFCQRYEGFVAGLAGRAAVGAELQLTQEIERLACGARNLGALPLGRSATGLAHALARGGLAALVAGLPEVARVLDSTILAIESQIRAISEPFDWPSAAENPAPLVDLPELDQARSAA